MRRGTYVYMLLSLLIGLYLYKSYVDPVNIKNNYIGFSFRVYW